MAKTYTVASEEGANFARSKVGPEAEVGSEVELDLDDEQELALTAAGWLELVETKKKGG